MMAASKLPEVSGELLYDEPMHRHTSWRVGGPAEIFFKPADVADLAIFLRGLDGAVPVFWFGLGSNLLVRDGGLPGVVVATAGVFDELRQLSGRQVRVGASVPCTSLARQCVRWGLGPAEFFAGIPGVLGGALAMNAGAHGGETWERVASLTTMDRYGELRQRLPADYRIGYRSVRGPENEWFLGATLQFDAQADSSMEKLQEMLARRKETQPLGLPSCGSVFRNPPGDHAARLIETAGLKGRRLGGAEVSPKHANFIINRDHASAADIENLISLVQREVTARHAVELVPEVRIVGEAARP